MIGSLGSPGRLLAAIALLASVSMAAVASTIQGKVVDSTGKSVGDASVKLERRGDPTVVETVLKTKTSAAGVFTFPAVADGSYTISAEKAGVHSRSAVVLASSSEKQPPLDLILDAESPGAGTSSTQAMEFADKPNFTVAGVTDWTAVGGHGSDSTLRTSEALARDTVTLKAPKNGPGNANESAAGLPQRDEADRHRRLGELDEKMGDPLSAVREEQQAVRLDPSEQNYFAWGSELLLHRAVWQAAEVFRNGVEAYPRSARMSAALGAALFAGARYDQAAASLCRASDLNPADPEPYVFMGKIEMAAPRPLACIEPRLARFVRAQPENSLANYFYAMALWKGQHWQQVESLLSKAVAIDPKCGDAYLQLGILAYSRHNLEKAIAFYTRAIEVDPLLGEAHYRLGVAFDRAGAAEKARQEFQRHDQIESLQAAAVEQQRREVKQFLVVLEGQPNHPPAQ